MKILFFSVILCAFSVLYTQEADILSAQATDIFLRLSKDDGKPKLRGEMSAVVNHFIDILSKDFDAYCIRHGYDSVEIPEIDQKFDGGHLTLSNATLNGLSTVNRTGDAIVSYSSTERKIHLQIPIDLIRIYFLSHFHVKILFVGAHGKVKGTVKEFAATINLSFDLKENLATVDSVNTKGMGPITVTFEGNGVIAKVASLVSRFISEVLQPKIDKLVQKMLVKVSNFIADKINESIYHFLHPNNTRITYKMGGNNV